MHKVLIINAKGGCGKTTIATNLASHYAAQGKATALFDYDPQGSSLVWLKQRPKHFPPIYGIDAQQQSPTTTLSWRLKVPPSTEHIVIDTPACLKAHELSQYLRGVHSVLIPILPSVIDTHATGKFIDEILQISKINRYPVKLYLIANRVNQRTKSFQALEAFIAKRQLPVLAHLRDTVNYVHASDLGIGIHELPHRKANHDREIWNTLSARLEEAHQQEAIIA